MIKETGEEFDDGSNIIYVNASKKEDSDIGRLMHDFTCKTADDMYYEELSEKTRVFKESEEGRIKMSGVVEKLIEELKPELLEEGKLVGIKNIIEVYNEELSMTKEEIIPKIVMRFDLAPSKAREYVDRFYN